MKRRIICIILTLTIAVPFLLNLNGWNLFLYTHLGDKDLIIAASMGVSHIAWADPIDLHVSDSTFHDLYLDEIMGPQYSIGPFDLLTERNPGPITPWVFRNIDGDESYVGFEFPWFLLFMIPAIISRYPSRLVTFFKSHHP